MILAPWWIHLHFRKIGFNNTSWGTSTVAKLLILQEEDYNNIDTYLLYTEYDIVRCGLLLSYISINVLICLYGMNNFATGGTHTLNG